MSYLVGRKMNWAICFLFLFFGQFSDIGTIRKFNYRPDGLEDCDDLLLGCQRECESDGKMFCNFRRKNKEIKYAGCMSRTSYWSCCNDPKDNHEDCEKSNGVFPLKNCDAREYGEWRYMENTRGFVTCRHNSEKLFYSNNSNTEVGCKKPNYWCRERVDYDDEGKAKYGWTCLGPTSKCNELGGSIEDKTIIDSINNDVVEAYDNPIDEKKYSYTIIISVIVSVSVTIFILAVVLVIVCIITRRR
jgi:hypothetical protein